MMKGVKTGRGGRGRKAFLALLLLAAGGCSSTRVAHYSPGPGPPLCREGEEPGTAAVFWDAAWRENQKEREKREELFETAVRGFFESGSCYRVLAVSRHIGGRGALLASDGETAAAAKARGAEKAIVIRVEEAGPNLLLYLSPILWETRNEIFMRVKIIRAEGENLEADVSTRWIRGGPFTMIGAGSLGRDIDGSLRAVFYGPARQGAARANR